MSHIFPKLDNFIQIIDKNSLSGILGTNREINKKCQIRANNDLDAIFCWLDRYKSKITTYRCYKKESERLLLWCLHSKKKALSSFDDQDFTEYFNFLKNPEPKEFWCSQNNNKRPRSHPDWKPFSGPLKTSSITVAISAINSLMEFLYKARYTTFNPLSLLRLTTSAKPDSFVESKIKLQDRILEDPEWAFFKYYLINLPEDTTKKRHHKCRLRFIIAALFLLGLRISELESSNWSAFKKHDNKWWFYVVGKGDKLGMIPVNNELMYEVALYRESIGMLPIPEINEDFPILQSVNINTPLTSRHIHRLIKNFATTLAEKHTDPNTQSKFRKFSPHWLRHLSATLQDKSGILFKHIQANHRHSNENTTRRYVHALDSERHLDMEKLELFDKS